MEIGGDKIWYVPPANHNRGKFPTTHIPNDLVATSLPSTSKPMLLSSSEDSMQTYRDIDYDSFLDADFDSDLHWILLPAAELAAQQITREAALANERLAQQQGSLVVPDIWQGIPDQESWGE